MNCPKCSVELESKEDDQIAVQRCGQCGGIWMEAADLNRVLLRHNLSNLEKQGGKPNLEELEGQCPQCEVDLVAIEGGPRHAMRYDTCESCGGIWFSEGLAPDASLPAMVLGIVSFYKRFAA